MRGCRHVFVLGLLIASFAGCSDEHAADPREASATEGSASDASSEVGTAAALEAPVVPQRPTHGGDSSRIELQAVSAAQLATVGLPGELACTFEAPALGTLLVARADVLPDGAVRAVVNNNGYTGMLANGQAGGFNDLLDGIALDGKGLVVRIERGAAQATGDKSTRFGATLTVQRAEGAQRTYEGTWTCGP